MSEQTTKAAEISRLLAAAAAAERDAASEWPGSYYRKAHRARARRLRRRAEALQKKEERPDA